MQVFGIDNRLIINQKKLCNYDGNEHIDNVDWNIASPIEMIIVDCGRTLLVNDGWWNVFSPSFVKNKTLIVMQDWQTYKQIPDLHYNQTKIFTDSKLNQIELIHELDGGSIATFIYRG
ncbi:hypothetical protein H6F47_16555 [Sphaerospermopsis sp. FACHB-1094]|uniref:hypothetical protein n=1 Tax=Sphaerospermopsis sp. FACHB-1094 TaxID=2692861 RepID=UPI0016838930|nr:hypothetical protein [Sphaerospermopsis sp. FACHB-1094]MBD2133999.1 hypothetical protein [Sphaerospermopsis sp. FACHB-1094]